MGILVIKHDTTVINTDFCVTAYDACDIKHSPGFRELETVNVPVAKGRIVVDSVGIIETKIAFPVKVETSKAEVNVIGKLCINIPAIPVQIMPTIISKTCLM